MRFPLWSLLSIYIHPLSSLPPGTFPVENFLERRCAVLGVPHIRVFLSVTAWIQTKANTFCPMLRAQSSPSLLQGKGRGGESSWRILLLSSSNLVPESAQNVGGYSGDRLFCWWGRWMGHYTKLSDLTSLELWQMSFLSSALAGVTSWLARYVDRFYK